MSAVGHERRAALRRREVRRIVRDAQRAGHAVRARNARLAASIDSNLLPEQAVAVIAASVAHAAEIAQAPAAAPRAWRPRRSRLGAIRAAVVGVVLVGATASTLSTADMQQTHAWFTAQQTTSGNTVTAAVVKVAGLGPDLDPEAKLSVTNLLPLSDTDAADPTRGVFLDLTVRNTGSVPVNWTLALTNVPAASGAVDLGSITNVSFSVAGGAWSTPKKLSDSLSVSGQNLPPGANVNTAVVRVRFWLDKNAGNEAQGAVAQFTTDLKAIQTGAS